MKTYAVFFKNYNKIGAVLERVEDVTARWEELQNQMGGDDWADDEQVAAALKEKTGADAVVHSADRAQAILYAADACGIEGYIEG